MRNILMVMLALSLIGCSEETKETKETKSPKIGEVWCHKKMNPFRKYGDSEVVILALRDDYVKYKNNGIGGWGHYEGSGLALLFDGEYYQKGKCTEIN